ncbi:hypothetical protein BJ508DRAFT_359488 [Ascobolus immersus RN42]|uniref:Uncharacterized protein n=1 Tax=Ascobolus immersus RN42 TaxID=1160509 RepID=A0A3N4IF59_ASCIM|nr:hypothetical protein BJ508DRAFT_359488 [Ascobolus immersus RN42]
MYSYNNINNNQTLTIRPPLPITKTMPHGHRFPPGHPPDQPPKDGLDHLMDTFVNTFQTRPMYTPSQANPKPVIDPLHKRQEYHTHTKQLLEIMWPFLETWRSTRGDTSELGQWLRREQEQHVELMVMMLEEAVRDGRVLGGFDDVVGVFVGALGELREGGTGGMDCRW